MKRYRKIASVLLMSMMILMISGMTDAQEISSFTYGNIPPAEHPDTPFTYGTVVGVYGKSDNDKAFFFSSQYNGAKVPSIYDVSSVNIVNPYVNKELDAFTGNDGIIHLSYEIARAGVELGGTVQLFPYVDNKREVVFNGGGYLLHNNNGTKGVQLLDVSHVLGNSLLPLNQWNKLDYVFYCDYNGTSAVDIYFNGNCIAEKQPLDADASMAGNQKLTGLSRIQFCFNMQKSEGTYPLTTTYVDNIYCDTENLIEKIELTSTNTAVTIDNLYRTIRSTETSTVGEIISTMPENYQYVFSRNGAVLDELEFISGSYLRIEDSEGNPLAYYYVVPSSSTEISSELYYVVNDEINGFDGLTVEELIAATKTDGTLIVLANGTETDKKSLAESGMILRVVSADGNYTKDYLLNMAEYKPYFGFDDVEDGIPEYYSSLIKYYIPDADVEGSPYTFGLKRGVLGKSKKDSVLSFISSYATATIPEMDGISAANITKPQLRYITNTGTFEEDDIVHLSFEICRAGTESGFKFALTDQGNKERTLVEFHSSQGLRLFGSAVSSDIPVQSRLHKFDIVYYINYNGLGYTAGDAYFNGEKLVDKKKIDYSGILSAVNQIRIYYGMTKEGNLYPKTETLLDNISISVSKQQPIIEGDGLMSTNDVTVDKTSRTIKLNCAMFVSEFADYLNGNCDYSFVVDGEILDEDQLIRDGFLAVKSSGEIIG